MNKEKMTMYKGGGGGVRINEIVHEIVVLVSRRRNSPKKVHTCRLRNTQTTYPKKFDFYTFGIRKHFWNFHY